MEKKVLGKGLAALLADIRDDVSPFNNNAKLEALPNSTNTNSGVTEISLSLIDNNPDQPRKHFDDISLRELAESIKQYGILQPLILLDNEGRYLIIAGERRFRAAKLAGLNSIPAIIKALSPQQIKEIAIIENLQREDLNPIETAEAIRDLMFTYNISQEEVAVKIGKSRPSVTNTLRLLQLDNDIIDLVRNERLSAGHARALVSMPNKDYAKQLALKACDGKMSVRDLEMQVKLFFTRQSIPVGTRKKDVGSLEMRELIIDMKRIFGTKVKAVGSDNKGRIYIDYFNNDDLQRIFVLIDVLKKNINRED